MANLTTSYAGLKLRNPFIISSSGITGSVEKIRRLDALGAGAIVLKSLFEEQILLEASGKSDGTDDADAMSFIRTFFSGDTVSDYMNLVREAKKAVSVPVIASINCISALGWFDFASRIQDAGADALELNVFFLPLDRDKPSAEYENVYFNILEGVKKRVSIPVIIKLSPSFTNLTWMVNQLSLRKADAVVLFNRFYEPDINITDLKLTSAEVFSSPADMRTSLRWVGIISGSVPQIDIAASTGVHTGDSAIKQILAGAKAVQISSVLYKNGIEFLPKLFDRFETWMLEHSFKSLDEFRGKMSYAGISDPAHYERTQFMKYFSSQS